MPVSAETLAVIMKHVKDPEAVLEIVQSMEMSTVDTVDLKRRREQERLKKQRYRDKKRAQVSTVDSGGLSTVDTSPPSLSKNSKGLEEGKEGRVITTAVREEPEFGSASAWPQPKPEPKLKRIGTRVPEDFFPEPVDCDVGFERGMTEADIESEHLKFMDFWRAKAGKDATKLNWNAAFRYWLRNANDYKFRQKIPAQQSGSSNGHYRR
jgi:hypothetical protein